MDRSGDTIYALATPPGRSAVAIVRLSGPRVRFAFETMTGAVPAARIATLRSIRVPETGKLLDRAIVLFFPAPHSQTGEDCGEFQIHGGRAVIAAILAELARLPGFRAAEPGEFSRRALFNGKINLLELEALADLVDSETERQRQQSLGSGIMLRGMAEHWRQLLLDVRAELEAGIDFADEDDVARQFVSRVPALLDELIQALRRALAGARRGERIRDGFRVALLGPPNAGKSSLINALAGRDVAIVSNIAGTTRDRIDVTLDIEGYAVIVSDTAGIRLSDELIEREGIRRSFDAAAEADLAIWLHPDGSTPPEIPAELIGRVKVVLSKSDLVNNQLTTLAVDAIVNVKDEAGLDPFLAFLGRSLAADDIDREAVVITRERQRRVIDAALGALERARESADFVEICAEEVRLGILELDRLLGRVDVEEVLGAIFSRFCIGK